MKKDHILIISLILLFFTSNAAFADDFALSDWGFYSYREKANITENADDITYEKVRREHDFGKYFDRQKIIIHKKMKNISPKEACLAYISRKMLGDKKAEKYIIKDNDNDFIACYCSDDDKRCEIVRFYNGFDGLIEVRYTHNNLWHFQNNIGSFLSAQMKIRHLPYEFTINKLVNDKRLIRL